MGENTWLKPERPALEVARDLLGAQLCRQMLDGAVVRIRITEVEAYMGPEDKACHAARGRTPRNEVMFGPAGRWYIYLCYGVHWLANLVTGPEDFPAAVLLRGAGEWEGPGRLSKALSLTGKLNGLRAERQSGLWIEAGGAVPDDEVYRGPRVGIDSSGPEWVAKPYRLIWKSAWAGQTSRLQ